MAGELTPEIALALGGVVVVNTLTLGVSLAIFRPGEHGYFARHGTALGWLYCLGVTCVLAFVAVVGVPLLGSAALWWVAALGFFQLTVRQTIKLNIIFAARLLALNVRNCRRVAMKVQRRLPIVWTVIPYSSPPHSDAA